MLCERKGGERGWSSGGSWRSYSGSSYARSSFLERYPHSVLYAILGANALVFAGFQLAEGRQIGTGQKWFPDLYTMYKNFTVSADQIYNGRYHTLITSAFAHRDPPHLLFNMLGLYSFGMGIIDILGPKRFLAFYFVAAFAGSVAHCAWQVYNRSNRRSGMPLAYAPALGASGAVNALSLFYATLMPRAIFSIFGVIPLPAFIACSMFVAYDLYGAMRPGRSNVGHAAHLGGAALGLAAGILFRMWPRRGLGGGGGFGGTGFGGTGGWRRY